MRHVRRGLFQLGATARLLAYPSSLGVAAYYRCDACGQVWVQDRRADLAPQRVTNSPQRASSNDQEPLMAGRAAAPAGVLHFGCPCCHQAMEAARVVLLEWEGEDASLIYRCASDGTGEFTTEGGPYAPGLASAGSRSLTRWPLAPGRRVVRIQPVSNHLLRCLTALAVGWPTFRIPIRRVESCRSR